MSLRDVFKVSTIFLFNPSSQSSTISVTSISSIKRTYYFKWESIDKILSLDSVNLTEWIPENNFFKCNWMIEGFWLCPKI